MAIAFRAGSDASRGASTSPLSVPAPTGTAAGDVMVMLAAAGATNPTITATGWTSISGFAWVFSTRLDLFWKVAGASEPAASVNTSVSTALDVLIAGFSGVNTTTPFDVAAAWGTNNNGVIAIPVPGITTVTNNAWWTLFAVDGSARLSAASVPAGWTQRRLEASTVQVGQLMCDTVLVATAGAQSATTFNRTGSSGNCIVVTLALKEAAAAAPAFVPQIAIVG